MLLNKMLGEELHLDIAAARLQQHADEITGRVLGRILMGLVTRAVVELQYNGEAAHGSWLMAHGSR